MFIISSVIILVTGTIFAMWLGEKITDKGIGNGISLLIMVGIIANLPLSFTQEFISRVSENNGGLMLILIELVLWIVIILLSILLTLAVRRIPVQYARRQAGGSASDRTVYGSRQYIPLRLNASGVMPIIFAQAILMFPDKIFSTLGRITEIKVFDEISALITYGSGGYMLLEGLMILFFSYFWVATQFNEIQIADDLKKYGGYIPGVRPGTATSDFLHRTMSRITFAGAMFLTGIAIIPLVLTRAMNIPFAAATFFGGTSLLITVGVVLDTMRQMESHLLTRHYDGFLKKGKIKGRF
jgi:preprotein translocase subunit SecY